MREIKFRSWNGKDMAYNITVAGDTSTEEDGEILMQYTGIKDKNGVEIYEGDWVELKTPHKLPYFLTRKPDIDGKYVVTWGYAGFQYERQPAHGSMMNDYVNMGEHPNEVEIEVIGDIYQGA